MCSLAPIHRLLLSIYDLRLLYLGYTGTDKGMAPAAVQTAHCGYAIATSVLPATSVYQTRIMLDWCCETTNLLVLAFARLVP